jgi:2-polyprenyl-3-methyl-5-hydroxy-6-metoxy-1,4-benzoquinol methylase
MANTSINNKAIFLRGLDVLANEINTKANELFYVLQNFDAPEVNILTEHRDYFINHHLGPRLFFSLQNSAHIIYDAVKKSGKPVREIQFIDYGAGLGTLFMLAGMMGFKRIVYNDYLPDWQQTAQSICETLNIKMDGYVTGDIDSVMQHAAANGLQYDIIASRNVIEHIYNLPQFYTAIFRHNPKAVTYSTTTANYHNPAMNCYHIYIHQQTEKKYYRRQRSEEIKKLQPLFTGNQLAELTAKTRGKGQQDFIDAVNNISSNNPIKKDKSLRSNTCDCITGVWIEHLLTKKEHGDIIEAAGFKMQYTAGYWDTHYASGIKNKMAGIFNKIIALLGKENGIVLSPFVNVVAYN